jgi:hypothetical protein
MIGCRAIYVDVRGRKEIPSGPFAPGQPCHSGRVDVDTHPVSPPFLRDHKK